MVNAANLHLLEQIGVAGMSFILPHAILNLIMVAKLNPLFDPDLRPTISQEGFKAAYWRALGYTGAVATRRGRQVSGWLDYDFVSKVGPATVFWCRVSLFLCMVAVAGTVLLGLKLALAWLSN